MEMLSDVRKVGENQISLRLMSQRRLILVLSAPLLPPFLF
jgi:hypothetical protein